MKRIRIVAVLVSLLCVPMWVQARDKGPYLGAGFGLSILDGAGVFLGTPDIEQNDSGFRLLAGWKLNERFGLELSYADLGSETIRGSFGDRFVIGDDITTIQQSGVVVEREASSIDASAVFFHDFNKRVASIVRVGGSSWQIETSAPPGSLSPELPDDDGFGLHVGFGLGVKMAKRWDFETEIEYYSLDDLDVFGLTAGVVIAF